jgi:hypothetical protein
MATIGSVVVANAAAVVVLWLRLQARERHDDAARAALGVAAQAVEAGGVLEFEDRSEGGARLLVRVTQFSTVGSGGLGS